MTKKFEDRNEIRNTKKGNGRRGNKTANMKMMGEKKAKRITETNRNKLRE